MADISTINDMVITPAEARAAAAVFTEGDLPPWPIKGEDMTQEVVRLLLPWAPARLPRLNTTGYALK